jgi:hypothetical protein
MESNNAGGKWISIEEAAKRLFCTEKDILRFIKQGHIKIQDHGNIVVYVQDVARIREAMLFHIPLDKRFPPRKWAMRICLLCDQLFRSPDPECRICKTCRPLFDKLRSIYPEGMINIRHDENEGNEL